jgi:hypothetical protein
MASRVEKVQLDEYGVELFIRPLSALERAKIIDKYGTLSKDKENSPSFETITIETQCFVVCRGLVEENGKRLYGDDEAQKLAEEFPCEALDQLSKRIMTLSGMDKKQDNLIKKSNSTPNADSSIVLQ